MRRPRFVVFLYGTVRIFGALVAVRLVPPVGGVGVHPEDDAGVGGYVQYAANLFLSERNVERRAVLGPDIRQPEIELEQPETDVVEVADVMLRYLFPTPACAGGMCQRIDVRSYRGAVYVDRGSSPVRFYFAGFRHGALYGSGNGCEQCAAKQQDRKVSDFHR